MKTLKHKISRNRTIRKKYGGATRKELRNAVNVAIANLNAALISNSQRNIVKNRLRLLYGSSETWRMLRKPPAVYPNSITYNSLPPNIKLFVQGLNDRLLELFASRGNLEYDYNNIILELIKNNLYKKTQEEANISNSNNNVYRSNNYKSNNESEPFAGPTHENVETENNPN